VDEEKRWKGGEEDDEEEKGRIEETRARESPTKIRDVFCGGCFCFFLAGDDQ